MTQQRFLAALAVTLVAGACGREAAPTDPERLPSYAVSAVLAAPTALGPADGASVMVPFAISWSSVLDTTATNGGYNWQVSRSPSFSPLVIQDATRPNETRDAVSGLPSGTYYWRVNAVDAALNTSAWSATRSFAVTGAGPGTPGTPTLAPTQGYSTFHPREVLRFNWSPVPDAVTYRLEVSNDRNFPMGSVAPGVVTFWNENIAGTTDGFEWGVGEGTYFARVFAVSADNPETGIRSLPSNVVAFSVSYNNPIGPPPTPTSPADGVTLTLPLTLEWAHVPNPQPSGYEVQVSPTADFATNETVLGVQLTEPRFLIKTLTAGNKFWRVRSAQGMASATTMANTAWSAARSFTLSTAPSTPVSIIPVRAPLYSGDDTWVEVQLTAGVPAGGATVALSSSHPGVAPVPASLSIPGRDGVAEFQMTTGQVAVPTTVTLTATLNGVSTSNPFTLRPTSLGSLTSPAPEVAGGVPTGATLMLNGVAPSGGATVSLTSNSPAATPPSTVTIPAGGRSAAISIPTSEVTTSTAVVVTASWNGATVQMPFTVRAALAPASLSLFPATIVGGGSSTGRVTMGSAANFDQSLRVTSNNPAVLPFLSSSVTIPAGSTLGAIQLLPATVSATTVVTISVTGGGVTRSADLTVTPPNTPPPAARLTSFTVTPGSVQGGTPATGRVGLASAAPAGGTVVLLGSNLPGAASVPASVTLPANATSATFPITTFPGAGTTAQLNAKLDDAILFASLGVTAAPPPSPAPTLSAPTLVTPANDARFSPGKSVAFDWSDVTGAASYTIEIDDSDVFSAPLVASQTVTASQLATSALPTRRIWWRVRANSASGAPGPWSSVRRLEVK